MHTPLPGVKFKREEKQEPASQVTSVDISQSVHSNQYLINYT